MTVQFNTAIAADYKSQTQKIRVLSETWTGENIYCPRCGFQTLTHFPNNQEAADFFCPKCKNEYELKSKKGTIRDRIPNGAYDTLVKRITSNNNPDFFLLNYDSSTLCVSNFWVIPKFFFTPAIVEKRKALSPNARRSGWVGCNILIGAIPPQGRISLIRNGISVDKELVLSSFERATSLQTDNLETRGWLLDVLNCINQIPSCVFQLDQVYAFESELQARHPVNHNVCPKIRQQLQNLRDRGYIRFLGRGRYQKLF